MESVKDTEVHVPEREEEHIHLPSPSWAPILLALGMAGVAFGVVLGGVVLALGAVLLIVGLSTWVLDEIRNAGTAEGQHTNPPA